MNSRFYQSQNAPKLAFLSSKIETFSGEGNSPYPDPSPGGEGNTTFPHLTFTPTALDSTRAFGARPRRLDPRRFHSPPFPATPSGSAPGLLLGLMNKKSVWKKIEIFAQHEEISECLMTQVA